ncbi:translation initiation factor IF-2 [Halpernia sp. GG3]
MPKIRLNKAVKELNISIPRAVDFLQTQGMDVENNPNTVLEEKAFSALEAEFRKDGEQKKASHEVVIAKVPEEKLQIEVQRAPEVIRAKADPQPETKILGKIDLNPVKPTVEQPKVDEVQVKAVEVPAQKLEEVAKSETVKQPEKKEFKVLDKIDLSQIEGTRPRNSRKESPKVEKPVIEERSVIEQPVKAAIPEPVVGIVTNTVPEEPESQVIETVYKKLEGVKILKQTVDLSQFNKPKPAAGANKKKRKRIEKPATPGASNTGATGAAGPGGANRPPQQNRPGGPGNNNNRGGGSPRPGTSRRSTGPSMPVELTEEQVKNQIKETLEKLTNKKGKSKGSKYRKEKRVYRREQDDLQNEADARDTTLKVTEFISVGELASLMEVSPMEVISACFSLGVMVTMNQRLEADTLLLVADEFGFKIEFSDADLEESITEIEADAPEDLLSRAPIVTVMGHVDHGKTSLLDYIRKTNVIAGESGGITQHIGAYNVELETGQRITFLDTPGHEAFTAMRARGAQVTDIAIIVIAADDDVMPQTKEAIAHAQAAGVPMIIALNKMDRPGANPDKVREQLSAMNVLVEEWGGNVQSQEVSAKVGTNMEALLEKVLLQAELLELTANPDKLGQGVVIEASLDKGRGYVSTVLVQSGTLKIGDYVLAGTNHGKIKAMLDERGNPLETAGPAIPVTILGLDGAPTAGDKFRVFTDEKEAKTIANKRDQLQREQSIRTKKHLTLDEIGRRIALGEFKELNIILKGDVDGSVEALSDMLVRLSTEEIQVNILHKGVWSDHRK